MARIIASQKAFREIVTDDAGVALNFARGYALDAHVELEQSLCQLLAALTGLDPRHAGLIMFKINNARSRDAILEKLIKEKFGAEFSIFWSSFFKESKIISDSRNKLAHWSSEHVLLIVDGVLNLESSAINSTMRPPNFWWKTEKTPELAINDILSMADKYIFFSCLVNLFVSFYLLKDRDPGAFADIFQSPITYPPPETHELYTKPLSWRAPPPPS